jgi:hypothetical protein
MKPVGFKALLKETKVKSLVSGDKSMRITLEVDAPPDELVDQINKLHRADRLVDVKLAEDKD